MTSQDSYPCCDNYWFPTTSSFTFLAEYKLDAEGTFSLDKAIPYKRHLHIVEGLGSEKKEKIVHVSDVVSAQWVLGLWRNTRTRAEFVDGVCVSRKMENYVTNTGGVLHHLPMVMTTRGVGKNWTEDSMYLTTKAIEIINRLNPSSRKSVDLPVSVLRRSGLQSGQVLSVYPVTFPHPPPFLMTEGPVHKDHKKTVSEMTMLRGTIFTKNESYEEWLCQGMEEEETKSLQYMKGDLNGVWRCLCCCGIR